MPVYFLLGGTAMIARDFPEQNRELGPPPGMTTEECHVLPVHADGTQIVSCWQPTPEERAAIAAGGPIWLIVWGSGMPPVALCGTNPYEQTETSP